MERNHQVLLGVVLALLASQLCNKRAVAELTKINYAFMFSGGGTGGFNSSGSLPAVELAEDMIRANSSILAGYNLTHIAARDSRVGPNCFVL